MAVVTAEENLLFGLLAMQSGHVSQDELLTTFRAWIRDKSQGLADRLVRRGHLQIDEPH